MLLNVFSVFLGGGMGSLFRYFVSVLMKNWGVSSLIGTFAVNVIGCFLIGVLLGVSLNKMLILSKTIRLFFAVGILGGLTTFSTLNLEVFELMKIGKIFSGLLYMFFSCFWGLLFTYLGYLSYSKICGIYN